MTFSRLSNPSYYSDLYCRLPKVTVAMQVLLATRGHRVHAVDASEVGLDKARSLASERNVSIDTEGRSFLELAEVHREVHGGRYYDGPSAAVQCLAKKS